MQAVSVLFNNGGKTFQSDDYINYNITSLIHNLENMVKLRNTNNRDGVYMVTLGKIKNLSYNLYQSNNCTFEII